MLINNTHILELMQEYSLTRSKKRELDFGVMKESK
jgi:hypothetical protein